MTVSTARAARFTLIELLVVIGIISILAGMFFGAIGRTRERGKEAVCASNLKQVVFLHQQYANSYGGAFCTLYDGTDSWDASYGEDGKMSGEGILSRGSAGGLDAARSGIFLCPSVKSDFFELGWTPKYAGYGVNECLGYEAAWGGSPVFRQSFGMDRIKTPSRILIAGDAGYRDAENNVYVPASYARTPVVNSANGKNYGKNNAFGTIDFRHSGSANAGYVDGHVARTHGIYPVSGAGDGVRTGFLSPDNSAYDPEMQP